jgi:hypothetical protein
MVNTWKLASGENPAKPMLRVPITYKPPAKPASAPENTNAVSLARTGLMENAAAARSLSRTATTARPARLRRKLRARSNAAPSAIRQK